MHIYAHILKCTSLDWSSWSHNLRLSLGNDFTHNINSRGKSFHKGCFFHQLHQVTDGVSQTDPRENICFPGPIKYPYIFVYETSFHKNLQEN